jgi:hypothetical protein
MFKKILVCFHVPKGCKRGQKSGHGHFVRSKYFITRYDFIKEMIKIDSLLLKKIAGVENHVNILTKGVSI